MSRDLEDLTPVFRRTIEELLYACERSGYPMQPFCTLRDPFEQARLWRQSRTREEIEDRMQWLRGGGAGFLARCLESVGPQSGRHVTNALPGLSWHQWGEAVDCFWLVGHEAEWSVRKKIDGVNGYRHYTQTAADMGLNAGGTWHSFKDWPHVQLRREASPMDVFPLPEINDLMRERFGYA
ncbi:M15 family metallopeptidase [bacterium]|nr:M15 family metallopeptidase [bacterium]